MSDAIVNKAHRAGSKLGKFVTLPGQWADEMGVTYFRSILMSISATTPANAVVKAASSYVQQVTGGGQGTVATALAEATETPAVTAKEAAKGDVVAKRLLAKEQAAQAQQAAETAKEPGKGELVDQKG